jgi:hypothetical protein
MPRDSTVIAFRQPETIDDPLTEVAREGARRTSVRPCSSRSAPPNRGAFFLAWKSKRSMPHKFKIGETVRRGTNTPSSHMCGPFKVSSGGVGASR